MAFRQVLKQATGLTGVDVCKTPHHTLSALYGKILRALEQLPKTSKYRLSTEKLVSDRLNIVKTEPDVQKLETKLNAGMIEEAIIQAEHELKLARALPEHKPWEPLIEQAPKDQWRWPV